MSFDDVSFYRAVVLLGTSVGWKQITAAAAAAVAVAAIQQVVGAPTALTTWNHSGMLITARVNNCLYSRAPW